MHAVMNRTMWLAAALFLGLNGAMVLHAKGQEPGAVLKSQGLKRSSGGAWILAGEAAILKDVKAAQGLSARLRNLQEQQRALEMGNRNPQVLIGYYREQIDLLSQRIGAYDQELANLGPPGGNQAATVYHNMIVQERNALVTQQNRLSALVSNTANQRGEFQEFKKQFSAEVASVRDSYLRVVADLRKSVTEIMEKYTELAGKEEVKNALKNLSTSSKIKQKFGPSKELTSAVKWLGRLEASGGAGCKSCRACGGEGQRLEEKAMIERRPHTRRSATLTIAI